MHSKNNTVKQKLFEDVIELDLIYISDVFDTNIRDMEIIIETIKTADEFIFKCMEA